MDNIKNEIVELEISKLKELEILNNFDDIDEIKMKSIFEAIIELDISPETVDLYNALFLSKVKSQKIGNIKFFDGVGLILHFITVLQTKTMLELLSLISFVALFGSSATKELSKECSVVIYIMHRYR